MESKQKETKTEEKDFKEKVKEEFTNSKDETKKFSKEEIKDGKTMAILSYIIPPIPYFAEKKNKYVRFHAVQGMNLFIVYLGYTVVAEILKSVIKVKTDCGYNYFGIDWGVTCEVTPTWLNVILWLITTGFAVLFIIGLVYACTNKAKEVPLADKIKIIKK